MLLLEGGGEVGIGVRGKCLLAACSIEESGYQYHLFTCQRRDYDGGLLDLLSLLVTRATPAAAAAAVGAGLLLELREARFADL